MNKNYQQFSSKICAWGKENDREMPWKGEKNPYLIWLSEIILQQTKVEQGTRYFLAFKKKYPTIFELAKAQEEEVLKLWEGLGYYSRARNLHFTAKDLVSNYNGVFPNQFVDLLKFKGIGSYTAAAIASFAYEEPKAVVDGNVVRVLSRYFGIENSFVSASDKKSFQTFADKLIQNVSPSIYNQAIMDFGAGICTPKNVDCSKCFLKKNCFAFKNKLQEKLPLKKKKIKVKARFFTFIIAVFKDSVYLEKREQNDIWKGLYQFPLIEEDNSIIKNEKKLKRAIQELLNNDNFEILNKSKIYTQKLTHQKISANFVEIRLKKALNNSFLKSDINFLSKFAFPKIINVYLDTK